MILEQVVLASGNRGKLAELAQMMAHLNCQVRSQAEFAVPEAVESGTTFVENAIIKARNACHYTGLPAIADDSGITVEALNGAPGIYSARYAGANGNDQANLDKLLADSAHLDGGARNCAFVAVVVFMRHADDPLPIICTGLWRGELAREARGANGFGYDPIFIVPEYGCTSAELQPKVKNTLSHRGQAMRALLEQLRLQYGTHSPPAS